MRGHTLMRNIRSRFYRVIESVPQPRLFAWTWDRLAALSGTGRLLGTAQFPTTVDGYQQLVNWLRSFGRVARVGVDRHKK